MFDIKDKLMKDVSVKEQLLIVTAGAVIVSTMPYVVAAVATKTSDLKSKALVRKHNNEEK